MTSARRFLLTFSFELSLVAVALAAGRFCGIDLAAGFRSSPAGYFAAVLLSALGWLMFRLAFASPRPSLRAIRVFLEEVAGPFFGGIGPLGLALLAAAAGLGEEALFRGWLQTWIGGHFGSAAGCLLAALAFGLAHPITTGYAIYATAIGIALGALQMYSGGWLAPALAHGLYDFFALLWFLRPREKKI